MFVDKRKNIALFLVVVLFMAVGAFEHWQALEDPMIALASLQIIAIARSNMHVLVTMDEKK